MSASSSAAQSVADEIRATEGERLRSLFNGDMDVARRLIADDFQLVTPLGALFSKEQYLGGIAAGHLRYVFFEVDSPIDVRTYGEVVLIRYRAQAEVEVQGQRYARAPYWFTDAYERRDGRWQIVWSQGTGIV
jgi:hypothetical protein